MSGLRVSLYLLLIFPAFAYAQRVISGTVVDKATQRPIHLVNIYFSDRAQQQIRGTVTDYEGHFQIILPTDFPNDTLRVTHIGYRPVSLKVVDTSSSDPLYIQLDEEAENLQAVTVLGLTPKQYILECIKRKQRNYFDVTFFKDCFYWQWVKENDKYRYLSQSFLSVTESLSARSMNLKIDNDSIISSDPYYNPPFLHKIDDMFTFDIMRNGTHFMNIQNVDEWTFQYDNESPLGNDYVAINAATIDKSIKLKLLINDNNHAVEQIEYEYFWKPDRYHNLNDTLLYRLDAVRGRIIYKQNGSRYYLQFAQNHIEYSSFQKLTRKKVSDRIIENELVAYSCQIGPTQKNRDRTRRSHYFQGTDEIIANKKSFCEAALALNYHNKICQ